MPLLKMEGITKSFPGVKALDGVDFTLHPSSVHALMGENGAGKSTLMKCLFGVHSPDGGRIYLDGKSVSFGGPRDALLHGVAMVHQELNQALTLSIADNMWLGRFPRYPLTPIIDKKRMLDDTSEVFDLLGIRHSPERKIGELSVSERQMIEIAKAVSYGAKIIVFDEPTSSLTDREAERLFGIIEMLKKRGTGIIYISHKMAEILKISDTVTVMRDGRHIATHPSDELDNAKIIRLMVGRELSSVYPKRERGAGEVFFRAEGLSGEYSRLTDGSLTLKSGEILGIAGLDGSGRTELLEAIFGLSRLRSGTLSLDGKGIKNRMPREAMKNGFALLTEERRASGIFANLDIKENTTIASLKKISRGPFISDRRARGFTRDCIRKMRVKTPSEGTKIGTLSGGNQQKVILGRWLLTEPRVLLLDEPTRGIDVGAKYEIYTLLNSLAGEGRGIIMVSSEMPELIGMCDRIIVMSGGKVAGEVSGEDMTQEKIMELAARYAN